MHTFGKHLLDSDLVAQGSHASRFFVFKHQQRLYLHLWMVLQGLVVGDWMSVYKVVAITRTRLLVAPHTIHQCQTMRASSATVVQTSAVAVAPVQRARFPLCHPFPLRPPAF